MLRSLFFLSFSFVLFPSKLQLETFIRLTSFSFHIVRLCLPFLLYLFSVSSRYTFIRLLSFVVSLIRALSHIAPPLQHFISYLSISQTFSHPFVAAFYFTLLPPRAFQFPPSFPLHFLIRNSHVYLASTLLVFSPLGNAFPRWPPRIFSSWYSSRLPLCSARTSSFHRAEGILYAQRRDSTSICIFIYVYSSRDY